MQNEPLEKKVGSKDWSRMLTRMAGRTLPAPMKCGRSMSDDGITSSIILID